MSSRMLIVARKELLDAIRDRRAIATVLASALFGPLMIAFMLRHDARVRTGVGHISVPVVGADRAPLLVDWLTQQHGVAVLPEVADPGEALREEQAEVVLVISDGFEQAFEGSTAARLTLLEDDARPISVASADRLSQVLSAYSAEIATGRLIVRGVSPAVVNALDVRRRDVATSEERSAVSLNVLLAFMSLAVLTAGMQIATDATAGERERRSLEPLLLNPVPRWNIVAGKWIAALVWASVSLVFTLIAMAMIMVRLPLDVLGIRLHVDVTTGLLLLGAMWPLALLATAIQTYLGCFAKSFKEAQSYAVLLVLPVAALGAASIVAHVSSSVWMQRVPILAQYTIGALVMAGHTPPLQVFAISTCESVVIASVFLLLAARLFASERMILDS